MIKLTHWLDDNKSVLTDIDLREVKSGHRNISATASRTKAQRAGARTGSAHAAFRAGISAATRFASATTCACADAIPPSCQPGVWLSAALAK